MDILHSLKEIILGFRDAVIVIACLKFIMNSKATHVMQTSQIEALEAKLKEAEAELSRAHFYEKEHRELAGKKIMEVQRLKERLKELERDNQNLDDTSELKGRGE